MFSLVSRNRIYSSNHTRCSALKKKPDLIALSKIPDFHRNTIYKVGNICLRFTDPVTLNEVTVSRSPVKLLDLYISFTRN